MNERIQQFLLAENITQAQFADSIGIARAGISHILAGRNKPSLDFIERTVAKYPNLSLDWLITGKGKMYRNSPADGTPASDIPPASDDLFSKQDDNVFLPEDTSTEKSLKSANISGNAESFVSQRHIDKVIAFYNDGTFQEMK